MSVLNVTTGVQYSSLSAAITASSANDVIQISAGTYSENFPLITHSLSIESTGGMAYLNDPDIEAAGGNTRAVLYVAPDAGANLTLSGLAISGAVDANNNGAGVLFETGNGNLNITNCLFDNNQDGVLVGSTDSTDPGLENVTITNSEFDANGVGPGNPNNGLDHNLYVNNAGTLDITGSLFTGVIGGHEIKTRSAVNIIEDNRIQDGPNASASYSIDFATGGADSVIGNTIEKGPNASQKNLIAFCNSTTDPGSSLLIENNILIADTANAVALINFSQQSNGTTLPATIEGNELWGISQAGLFSDVNGPPFDNDIGNVFETGAEPTLNYNAPFCFAAGTRIATARGDVPVEALCVGDQVRTAAGGMEPVLWIGHRRVDCAGHPRPYDVHPVRVRAGAFGPGRPHADVVLSPDHSVFEGGVLIPIRYLLNGATVVQEKLASVTYYHVELPAHHVILADGLPCESYLDTGNRGAFANAEGPVQLHPDFALYIWERKGCAPLVRDGKKLADARRRLLAEAGALGFVTTRDAELTLLADGRALPIEQRGALGRVRMPARTAAVRLTSSTWVPAQMQPESDDTRRLGVAIRHLWLDGREASLDSAGFGSGWHAAEAGWRWTDGDAVLALEGVRELAFELAMTGTYWAPRPSEATSISSKRRAR